MANFISARNVKFLSARLLNTEESCFCSNINYIGTFYKSILSLETHINSLPPSTLSECYEAIEMVAIKLRPCIESHMSEPRVELYPTWGEMVLPDESRVPINPDNLKGFLRQYGVRHRRLAANVVPALTQMMLSCIDVMPSIELTGCEFSYLFSVGFRNKFFRPIERIYQHSSLYEAPETRVIILRRGQNINDLFNSLHLFRSLNGTSLQLPNEDWEPNTDHFENYRQATQRVFNNQTAAENANSLGGMLCGNCFSFIREPICDCDDGYSPLPAYHGGSSGWNGGDTNINVFLLFFSFISSAVLWEYSFRTSFIIKYILLLSACALTPGASFLIQLVCRSMGVFFLKNPKIMLLLFFLIYVYYEKIMIKIKEGFLKMVKWLLRPQTGLAVIDLSMYCLWYNPYLSNILSTFVGLSTVYIRYHLKYFLMENSYANMPNMFMCLLIFYNFLYFEYCLNWKCSMPNIKVLYFNILCLLIYFISLFHIFGEAEIELNYETFFHNRKAYYLICFRSLFLFFYYYYGFYDRINSNMLYYGKIRFNSDPKYRSIKKEEYFFALKYYDHFKIPSVPSQLAETPERLAFTLNQMNFLFETKSCLHPIDITHEFFYQDNQRQNLMNPLKKDTKLRSIFEVEGQKTGTSSYKITPHYEFSEKYNEKLLKYGENPKTLEYYWAGNDPDLALKTLNSTSRYGEEEFSFQDYDRESMLEAMKMATCAMFKNSRLTSIRKIIRKFEWKYSAGFGTVKNKKYAKRKELFGRMSRKEIGEYLRSLISKYDKLAAVSHVFPKMEWLHPDKRNKIRSVIGTPFLTYFMQQIFAFEPDHRFEYERTPFQVGRPLTGFGMEPVFSELRESCDYIFGLDFSAFDSTFNKEVMDIVRDLRCWGYENHAQADDIKNLIKLSYEMNYTDPLYIGCYSQLFEKKRGNATGCVSTSQTNCAALLFFKLQLFHEATGRPYRDFFNFFKLKNYGDDNLLGVIKNNGEDVEIVKGWVYRMVDICKQRYLGTINLKIEDEGSIYDCSFLSKYAIDLSEEEELILNSEGLYPKLGVAHDYEKLKGKFDKFKKSSSKLCTTDYVQKFAAFKLLSAHHPVFFNIVEEMWQEYLIRNPTAKHNEHFKIANINYKQVLCKHYKPMDKVIAKMLQAEGFESGVATDKSKDPFTYLQLFLNKAEAFLRLFDMESVHALALDADHNIFIKHLLKNEYVNRAIMDYLSSLSFHSSKTFEEGKVFFSAIFKPFKEVEVPLIAYSDTRKSYIDILLNMLMMDFRGSRSCLKFLHIMDPISYVYGVFNRINYATSVFFGILFNNFVPYTFYYQKDQLYNVFIIFLITLRSIGKYEGERFKIPILDHETEILRYLSSFRKTIVDFFLGVSSSEVTSTNNNRNYDEVIDQLDLTTRTLFSAPTGWGKSTSFVLALQQRLNETVYVVLPRVVNVKELYSTMSKWHPEVRFAAWFDQSQFRNPNPQIVFTTIQSFLAADISTDAFVIIDEAHINEPCYALFNKDPYPRGLSMTATPTAPLRSLKKFAVKGNTPFSIEELQSSTKNFESYMSMVFSSLRTMVKGDKALVFLPTKNMVRSFSQVLTARGFKTAMIYSGNTTIDKSADVFISTCVSDAGLTLPGVTRVYSTDIDLHVTKEKPYYYPLSNQTLKQRRGRTGRTCKGFFLKYHLSGVKTAPYSSTTAEFVAGGLIALCNTHLRRNLLKGRYMKYLRHFLGRDPTFCSKETVLSQLDHLSTLLTTIGNVELNPGPNMQQFIFLILKFIDPELKIFSEKLLYSTYSEVLERIGNDLRFILLSLLLVPFPLLRPLFFMLVIPFLQSNCIYYIKLRNYIDPYYRMMPSLMPSLFFLSLFNISFLFTMFKLSGFGLIPARVLTNYFFLKTIYLSMITFVVSFTVFCQLTFASLVYNMIVFLSDAVEIYLSLKGFKLVGYVDGYSSDALDMSSVLFLAYQSADGLMLMEVEKWEILYDRWYGWNQRRFTVTFPIGLILLKLLNFFRGDLKYSPKDFVKHNNNGDSAPERADIIRLLTNDFEVISNLPAITYPGFLPEDGLVSGIRPITNKEDKELQHYLDRHRSFLKEEMVKSLNYSRMVKSSALICESVAHNYGVYCSHCARGEPIVGFKSVILPTDRFDTAPYTQQGRIFNFQRI